MREIKFRGRRIDNGRWVYGHYFMTPLTDENSGMPMDSGWFFLTGKTNYCIAENGVAFVVDPETVGQFTGLHDKNNNPIYEGDEVDYEWNDSWSGEWVSKSGVVEYNNGEYFPIPNNDSIREFEVTGNIYESPLIK